MYLCRVIKLSPSFWLAKKSGKAHFRALFCKLDSLARIAMTSRGTRDDDSADFEINSCNVYVHTLHGCKAVAIIEIVAYVCTYIMAGEG
jgi:hypothetical protein